MPLRSGLYCNSGLAAQVRWVPPLHGHVVTCVHDYTSAQKNCALRSRRAHAPRLCARCTRRFTSAALASSTIFTGGFRRLPGPPNVLAKISSPTHLLKPQRKRSPKTGSGFHFSNAEVRFQRSKLPKCFTRALAVLRREGLADCEFHACSFATMHVPCLHSLRSSRSAPLWV